MIALPITLIMNVDTGYGEFGTGPVPIQPAKRKQLGEYLDLVDKGTGQLVFDVDLLLIADDDNDQGESWHFIINVVISFLSGVCQEVTRL